MSAIEDDDDRDDRGGQRIHRDIMGPGASLLNADKSGLANLADQPGTDEQYFSWGVAAS